MSRKLLKNGTILDVVGKNVLVQQSILIDGCHIKAIGPAEHFIATENEMPPEAVFDLTNRMVLPGLIDSHVHLCAIQSPLDHIPIESLTVLENLRAPETLRIFYAAKHAKDTLESGFTTVRDVGSAGDNLALRDAVNLGLIPGPRIVACGWVSATAGQGERLSSEWQFKVALREPDVGVTGPWAVRKKVRRLVGQGVDAIKVFATGGGYQRHPFYPFWGDQKNFTLEELRSLVEEAHSAGLKVAGHAMVNTHGIKNAIDAGVDTLEHGIFLDESDVAAMKAKNIIYIPTLAVMETMWQSKDAKDMPYVHLDPKDAQKYLAAHKTSLKRAQAHGVKIAAGSDTLRVLRHGENAFELISLVNSGLSKMDALVAATINGAEALGIDALVGSIDEGKLADLLVVDPSPLDAIEMLCNRQNLKLIMKNGEIVLNKISGEKDLMTHLRIMREFGKAPPFLV